MQLDPVPGQCCGRVGPDRFSAKKEADAKGYTFFLSRDEIVAKAKQEESFARSAV
jgi:hypothetical protein